MAAVEGSPVEPQFGLIPRREIRRVGSLDRPEVLVFLVRLVLVFALILPPVLPGFLIRFGDIPGRFIHTAPDLCGHVDFHVGVDYGGAPHFEGRVAVLGEDRERPAEEADGVNQLTQVRFSFCAM